MKLNEMGEWANGRMGEWANGRLGDWETERMGIETSLSETPRNLSLPAPIRARMGMGAP